MPALMGSQQASTRGQPRQMAEELRELDEDLGRLRVFYEQYFAGARKRPPSELASKVQRSIRRFTEEAPRNTGQRFRFNQLNAKYQSYRQHWGRILREIEAGTYRPHRFRARLHQREGAELQSEAPSRVAPPAEGGSAIDRLARAFASARRKTGEDAEISTEKLAETVRAKTRALREKYGNAKIGFKVVVENNRAKLKATVKKN